LALPPIPFESKYTETLSDLSADVFFMVDLFILVLGLARTNLATLCENRKPQKILQKYIFGVPLRILKKYSKNSPWETPFPTQCSKNIPKIVEK
tara:strand:+ start:224 stop:505 length:282 start_codon:yes stop_codon:yes gene_type:complete